jgi:hypothetical protein
MLIRFFVCYFGLVYNYSIFDVVGDTGCGVYHMGSMFNHSCCPNSAFCHDSRGRILVVTLRPIRTGEEICVDYSELNVGLRRRRGDLVCSSGYYFMHFYFFFLGRNV